MKFVDNMVFVFQQLYYSYLLFFFFWIMIIYAYICYGHCNFCAMFTLLSVASMPNCEKVSIVL